jgi:NAD(P)H-dependent FMN reductase
LPARRREYEWRLRLPQDDTRFSTQDEKQDSRSEEMKIIAICGSLRSQSSNRALLQAAVKLAPEGMEITIYEGLAGLPHFNPDDDEEDTTPPQPVAELRALLAAADGILISSPEYAHGVPGSLKNALDWLVSDGVLVDNQSP